MTGLSDREAIVSKLNEGLTIANGASEAEGANRASFDPPSANPMDAQLINEFVGRCLFAKRNNTMSFGLNVVPWSQLDAVLRRLGTVF